EATDDFGTVARFGSDAFAVVVSGLDPAAAAQRVLAELDAPLALGDAAFDLKASIGIAAYPAHGDDVDLLIQRADVALNLAKRNRVAFEVYRPDRDQHSRRRLMLLGELRQAARRGELAVAYQPKSELATGRISGLEALLRWTHPDFGPVAP